MIMGQSIFERICGTPKYYVNELKLCKILKLKKNFLMHIKLNKYSFIM